MPQKKMLRRKNPTEKNVGSFRKELLKKKCWLVEKRKKNMVHVAGSKASKEGARENCKRSERAKTGVGLIRIESQGKNGVVKGTMAAPI